MASYGEKEPEGLDGGEGEDEEAAADAPVEEAGGERAVGAREGGVVVEREAGGPRLVSRAGGGGGASLRLERVRADSLEGGFGAEGSPVRGRRRRGGGGEARAAAEHLVLGLGPRLLTWVWAC